MAALASHGSLADAHTPGTHSADARSHAPSLSPHNATPTSRRPLSTSRAPLMLGRYLGISRDPASWPTGARSPASCAGSSSGESDTDGDEVPPTPGDDAGFASVKLKIAQPSPIRSNGVDLSRLFGAVGPQAQAQAQDNKDLAIALSPAATAFYPSFGDFLPNVKQEEEQRQAQAKANGVGLGLWVGSEKATTSDDIDSLAQRVSQQIDMHQAELTKTIDRRRAVAGAGDKPSSKSTVAANSASPVFDPFGHVSPNTDSFTFFPSPGFKAGDAKVTSSATQPTSTSASLRSPEPESTSQSFPTQQQQQHHSSTQGHTQLPGFPITPPRTPTRALSLRPTQHLQHSHSLPLPSPSPSRSTFLAVPVPPRGQALPASASSASYYPSASPAAIPVAVSPAPYEQASSGLSTASASAYPLSPADTDRIAKLHNGRIPTLEQLAPPEVAHPCSQQPIVNTGNQGPMVVQVGDWRCGVCSFVNWRRRKICLRCFPFANDIGNILTIQSQRAAHLAGPISSSAPSAAHAFPVSSPTSARFPLASPTRGYFDQASMHTASASMSRSATFPLANVRSQQPHHHHSSNVYASHQQHAASLDSHQATYYAYLVRPSSSSPSPTRASSYLVQPPSPTRYMHVVPSPVAISFASSTSPGVPPFLFSDESYASSAPSALTRHRTSASASTSSIGALSAGEHAARKASSLAARRNAGGGGGIKAVEIFPSITPTQQHGYYYGAFGAGEREL
ncbi:hypothetical protein JCM1841_001380 [Sporobolomyces salmonicolor]